MTKTSNVSVSSGVDGSDSGSLLWAGTAWGALVLVVVLDLLLGRQGVDLGLLAVPPLLAAITSGTRGAALGGVVGVTGGIALAAADGVLGTVDSVGRLLGVASATTAGVALSARYRHERARHQHRLRVLDSVAQVGLLPLGPDATLDEILQRIRAGLGADAATLLRLDPASRTLWPRASVGLREELATATGVPLNQGLAGRVAADRSPLLVADLTQTSPVNGYLTTAGMLSMAAVPLDGGGHVTGVLHVTSRRPSGFNRDDLVLLGLLADRVEQAVERVHAVERDRQAARALRDNEQRLRAILDTAVDAIVTIDDRGRIESVNAATEQLLGYPAAELIGSNVSLLMPQPDRDRHDHYLERYRQTGERHIVGTSREVLAQHRDGNLIPVELAVSEVQLSGRRSFTGNT